jgi:acetyl esterase/lipase
MAPNELPFLFIFVVVVSTAPSLVADGLSSMADWVELAIALTTVVGLVLVARRARRARPALASALVDELGERPCADEVSSRRNALRRRGLWWRVLFVPWPFRPSSVERVSNVAYGPDGESNLLDVYRHRSRPERAPTLVYFHGGKFRWGRKSFEALALLHRLADAGWTCISANYHLSREPSAGFPQHLVDAKRAIAWARTDGARFGVEPETIFVAGSSAGAHLAMMVALTANDPELQPGFDEVDTSIAGAIGLYGYYGRLDGTGRLTSPRDHVHDAAPPIFAVHGTNDTYTPIEGARALVDALHDNSRNAVVLAELPGGQHSFDVFHSIRFEAVVDAVEAFATCVMSDAKLRSGGASSRHARWSTTRTGGPLSGDRGHHGRPDRAGHRG